MEVIHITILILAFALDSWLGDPRWMPHLIVGYGHLIGWGEKWLNHGENRFYKGMYLTIVLVVISFWLPSALLSFLSDYEVLYGMGATLGLFYCIANKTLVDEGKAVFDTLKNKGIEAGRKRLSWIVGRDTSNLTPQQIRIATLETMSENLSDGVIVPLFYFMLLGLPGAMAYKMINTLDSMIGYKSDRYEKFGKFAAKLDDVANYIPARLTAVIMLLVSGKLDGLSFVFSEGKKHASPNAGYPEAALAYILSCRFGGPNVYHGQVVDKPFIGDDDRQIEHEEINQVVKLNFKTTLFFIGVGVVLLGLAFAL